MELIFPIKRAFTIAASASVSEAVALQGLQLAAIEIPSAMTGTSLSFTVLSGDGSTYIPLYDKTNTQYTITIPTASARLMFVEPYIFCAVDNFKVTSNGTEVALRTLRAWSRQV